MTRILAKTLIAFAFVAALSAAAAAENDTERQAADSVQAWLSIIDRGDYAGSWSYASPLFQSAITQPGWVQALSTVRAPLGSIRQRNRTSAQYTATLPGMPDGQYVVVQFATSFEKKASAVETITAVRDYDGYWRAGGYFIR